MDVQAWKTPKIKATFLSEQPDQQWPGFFFAVMPGGRRRPDKSRHRPKCAGAFARVGNDPE
jgi:hypothetical protein